MADPNPASIPPFIALFVTFLLFACVVSWAVILVRRCFRLPVLSMSPRRSVPWGGGDVLLLILAYILSIGLTVHVVTTVFDVHEKQASVIAADEPDSSHEVVKVLREGISTNQTWVLALAMFGTVFVAPIFEEFFFRVVFQGWLESLDVRLRLAKVPFGFAPIMITSLFFALLHFRTDQPDPGFAYRVSVLGSMMIASVVLMLGSIVYLKAVHGATAADLGWCKETFPTDVRIGVYSACAVLGPLFIIQLIATRFLPKTIAADPIPIFVLSIALGFLYLRTHRLVPGIVLHMCLNGVSLLMAISVFSGM